MASAVQEGTSPTDRGGASPISEEEEFVAPGDDDVTTVPSSGAFRPSPTETERDILAMELAVGLMYVRGADEDFFGAGEGRGSCWGDLGEVGQGL